MFEEPSSFAPKATFQTDNGKDITVRLVAGGLYEVFSSGAPISMLEGKYTNFQLACEDVKRYISAKHKEEKPVFETAAIKKAKYAARVEAEHEEYALALATK